MPRSRIVILGAGFAGLACANSLLRAGMDVVVLEARDRVGGRVWTLRDFGDGRPVEAGAMMVHGRNATLRAWLNEFGMHTERVPMFGGRIFYGGRVRSSGSLIVTNLRTALRTLWALPRAIERYRGPDISLAAFLAQPRISPEAARFLGWMYGGVNATDADNLSVAGLAEEAAVSTGGVPWRNYRVAGGYDGLATRRAEALGDRIRLKTRADRVVWEKGNVLVHASGPNGPERVEGRAAVVTVPLGVLQAGDIAFDPPLPEVKRRAIDTIGYGQAAKVLLALDRAFRKTPLGRAVFLADEDGGFFFQPYRRERDGPVILEGFFSGRRARKFMGRTEAEVHDEVLNSLQRMVPTFDVRSVTRAIRVVDWTSDPFARGAYSYPSLGGGLATRKRLAEPVEATLFFAGEATEYRGEYGTVHGAMETGERAAREVTAAVLDRGRNP